VSDAAVTMANDKDDGTAAIYREPMPPRKSCTSYHVFKILSIVYAIIFFVSASIVFLSDCHLQPLFSSLRETAVAVCPSHQHLYPSIATLDDFRPSGFQLYAAIVVLRVRSCRNCIHGGMVVSYCDEKMPLIIIRAVHMLSRLIDVIHYMEPVASEGICLWN